MRPDEAHLPQNWSLRESYQTPEREIELLGIGECMIELDASGSLIHSTSFERRVGGDVYNTLVAASRQGSACGFYSQIAADSFGLVLLEHFVKNNIDCRYVQSNRSGTNGLYFSGLLDEQAHEFVYYRQQSAASKMTPKLLEEALHPSLKIVYATGITQAISESARETVLTAFKMAKQRNITVAFDPNYRAKLWSHPRKALEAFIEVLPYVDILLPSMDDLTAIFDFETTQHALSYFYDRGTPLLLLKQGDAGVTLSFKGESLILPARPVTEIKDTIGAGDAFNGGFFHGLLNQTSLTECAELGLSLAAQSLSKRGPVDGIFRTAELEKMAAPI